MLVAVAVAVAVAVEFEQTCRHESGNELDVDDEGAHKEHDIEWKRTADLGFELYCHAAGTEDVGWVGDDHGVRHPWTQQKQA